MSEEYSETVEEEAGLRVRIIIEEGPSEPYDDGSSPLMRYRRDRTYGGWHAEQIEMTSHRVHPNIISALAKWGDDDDLFERYLRAFHGTTQVVWWDHPDGGDPRYVTFDTAVWRDEMGLTAEHLAKNPDIKVASMGEWRSYVEGDVWGYVVEKCVTWKPVDVDADEDVSMQTWEQVKDYSLWGLYGREYAEEAAREAFRSAREES